MGFFRRRNKDVLDLTEKYKRDRERAGEIQTDSASSTTDSSSAFGFLGDMASASSSSSETESAPEFSTGGEERKRKLTKRLLDMTEKIEDLSNQIYHLQQRIEVLERKASVGSY